MRGGMAGRRGVGRLGWGILLFWLLAGLLSPWIFASDGVQPVSEHFGEPQPPSWATPCGTDDLGRDVCARLLRGARLSLLLALGATAVSVGIGTGIGLLAGYFGGRPEAWLMRLTDAVLAFPVLLLAMALASVFEPGVGSLFLVIALVGWTGVARTVRAEVRALRSRDYVVAAVSMGAGPGRLFLHHLLPGVLPTLLVLGALGSGHAILLDAGLSFLGLGVPAPLPSWGRMLSESQTWYRVAPWLMVLPGVSILLVVTGFHLVAHGLGARPSSSD